MKKKTSDRTTAHSFHRVILVTRHASATCCHSPTSRPPVTQLTCSLLWANFLSFAHNNCFTRSPLAPQQSLITGSPLPYSSRPPCVWCRPLLTWKLPPLACHLSISCPPLGRCSYRSSTSRSLAVRRCHTIFKTLPIDLVENVVLYFVRPCTIGEDFQA